LAYYNEKELEKLGFKYLGKEVKISTKAAIYDCENISIGDYSRIDDFCIVSGDLKIGKYCHITPQCLIAAGVAGITIEDFCTFAYGVKIFSQSDDYSGESMTNSLIPKKYKLEKLAKIRIQSQSIIGAGSCILPGVTIGEGTAIGAMSLVLEDTDPWSIYFGIPAVKHRPRSQVARDLKNKFLLETSNDHPV
jgi:acetyltransferase-like isoleucine patch superfamily enzyme